VIAHIVRLGRNFLFQRGQIQHRAVINDAAFSTCVGEAAEYNSALREYAAPFVGRKLTPRLVEEYTSRFRFSREFLVWD